MSYYSKDWYTIVRKHWVIAFFFLLKTVLILIATMLLYIFTLTKKEELGEDIVIYLLAPIIFVFFNYALIKLALWIIEYFSYLFIIYKDQIFIINSSLILRDDIEIIDCIKIIKLDAYSRWLPANLLWYWIVAIEQQRNEIREFRFMPKPYKLLEKLKEQREYVLESKKKKYVLPSEEDII